MRESLIIDHMIRNPSAEGPRTSEEWSKIIDHLVHSLSTHLKQAVISPTKSADEAVIDKEALCLPVRSATISSDPFAISWTGTLGLEIIDGKPYVSASLFLFSQGRRLSVVRGHGSVLELVYEFDSNGVGDWRDRGWEADEFGEYDDYDTYP